MRASFSITTVAALLFSLLSPASHSRAAADLTPAIRATALVESFQPGTTTLVGRASGVIVSTDGWTLTNAHAVTDVEGNLLDIIVTPTGADETPNRRCSIRFPVGSFISGMADDLALLIPPMPSPCQPLTFLAPVADPPVTGTQIQVLGYPATALGGDSITATQGQIAGRVQESSRTKFLKTDTKIGSGNSGGPAIDGEGRFIGIATAITFIQGTLGSADLSQEKIGLLIPAGNAVTAFPEIRQHLQDLQQLSQASSSRPSGITSPARAAGRTAKEGAARSRAAARLTIRKEQRTRMRKENRTGGATGAKAPPSPTTGLPCTIRAWSCTVNGACSKKGEQSQKCALVDNTCRNPARVAPPPSRTCIPGKAKLEDMLAHIKHAIDLLNAIDATAYKVTTQSAEELLHLKAEMRKALEEYAGFFDLARKNPNVLIEDSLKIEYLEQVLADLEERLFSIPLYKRD